ncbi:MAG: hypothetical protein OIN85_05445 [Candidatus Methanoperedens sp.]|nr:hypothetical protein [Candidatus Methanoperedens sp.]
MKFMETKLQILIAIIVFGLITGSASGAVITFDKSLDVPDRDFTVTYEGSTFSFTIADIGNYKIGDNVNINVNGGANNMRLVLFTVDKLTPWFKTFYGTSGSITTTIPADRFSSSCPDVCDDGSGGYVMGAGIYALVIQNRDVDPAKYIITKPVIVSDYILSVTPGSTQASPGGVLKVTVAISKDGTPVTVAPNNVKVELVQDSTKMHFGDYATATVTTGTYEENIQIPSTASGNYRLYAAITTNRYIYQDYPEIIGASGYSGTIAISTPTTTPSTTSIATPFSTPTATSSTKSIATPFSTPTATPSTTSIATPFSTPTATPKIEISETVTPIGTIPKAVPTEKELPGFEAIVAILAISLASSLIIDHKRR